MRVDIHFTGGPLDGKTMAHEALWGMGSYVDEKTGSHYSRASNTAFLYTGQVMAVTDRIREEAGLYQKQMKAAAPLPEVTVHGEKLMTLGELAQFVDAARAAGYPDTQVPSVVNSFGGRIRSLTVKSRRRTT